MANVDDKMIELLRKETLNKIKDGESRIKELQKDLLFVDIDSNEEEEVKEEIQFILDMISHWNQTLQMIKNKLGK